MKHLLILLAIVTTIHVAGFAQAQRWLSYEPATVQLDPRDQIAPADAAEQGKPDPCPGAVTQLEINRCAGKHFRESDKKLNEVYKRILVALTPTDRANLVQAQRSWVKYRADNCWAERRFLGGSLAPTREAFCLKDITEERTKELMRIYETAEEEEDPFY